MIAFSWGVPPPPTEEQRKLCEEVASKTTEADIQRTIAECQAFIAEYNRKYPDDWKPDHLK